MASTRFCTQCGSSVEQDNAFCGSCGTPTGTSTAVPTIKPAVTSTLSLTPALDPEPQKRRSFGKVLWGLALAVIVAVLLIAISSGSHPANSAGSASANSAGSASADIASVVLPAAESQFISIVSEAQRESRQVENDMQRGGVKAKRDSALCQQMSSLLVSDWVGTVTKVDSNSDGKGVFYVNIAPDISVETNNNDLSDSLMGDHTLMEPGSPAFNAASAMKPGQSVIFSGTFLRGLEGDCIREQSMTLQGKVGSPEFTFGFSQVAPYTSSAAAHLTAEQTPSAQSPADDVSPTPVAAAQSTGTTPNQASVESQDTQNQARDNSSAPNHPSVDTSSSAQTNGVSSFGNDAAAVNQVPARRVNIPDNLAVGMLISKVEPNYPPIAKAARISGTVVLHATISTTGDIASVSVVSGPAMLQDAAINAVKQWRYRPYLVNNDPIEVETTINVIFTLGG